MDRCGLAGAGSHGSTVDCMDGDWSTVAYFGCGQEGESNQRGAEGENAAAARDDVRQILYIIVCGPALGMYMPAGPVFG